MTENTQHQSLKEWVSEIAAICNPDRVYWCDGSEEEKKRLEDQAVEDKVLLRLNEKIHPDSFYHRSSPNDVARAENLTFTCTEDKSITGPMMNWMNADEAAEKCTSIMRGSMKGRTLYVIPFVMGPVKSPYSKVGVQLSDSIYVALNMRIMTRMGRCALDRLGTDGEFTKCIHAMADLDIKKRLICHFPERNLIWSVGSAYGGNALLGKKCFALRIGSYLGWRQKWMAEHMLILDVKTPEGKQHYVAAAFPSQCGKTNLAMLVPPLCSEGYEVRTIGDDIAWLHAGDDGRLYAINPEAGFFGVAPGTGYDTNPTAMETVKKGTIFTNVGLKDDGTVFWEGMKDTPDKCTDWQGNPWTPESGTKAAHPNSRFTAPVSNCPTVSDKWEAPEGVPISAIIFGGRRAKTAPLVYESFSWEHGTYVGATVASETTAAAEGQVGVVRRDPMAMRPFLGYHLGDYLNHWLEMGESAANKPKIFHVNWFKTDFKGKVSWPGFGENIHALDWILKRVDGQAHARETPVGYVPDPADLHCEHLGLSKETIDELLAIHKDEWLREVEDQQSLFDLIGDRLPEKIAKERENLRQRLTTYTEK